MKASASCGSACGTWGTDLENICMLLHKKLRESAAEPCAPSALCLRSGHGMGAEEQMAVSSLGPQIAADNTVNRPWDEGVPPRDIVAFGHALSETIELGYQDLPHAPCAPDRGCPQQVVSAGNVADGAAPESCMHPSNQTWCNLVHQCAVSSQALVELQKLLSPWNPECRTQTG